MTKVNVRVALIELLKDTEKLLEAHQRRSEEAEERTDLSLKEQEQARDKGLLAIEILEEISRFKEALPDKGIEQGQYDLIQYRINMWASKITWLSDEQQFLLLIYINSCVS